MCGWTSVFPRQGWTSPHLESSMLRSDRQHPQQGWSTLPRRGGYVRRVGRWWHRRQVAWTRPLARQRDHVGRDKHLKILMSIALFQRLPPSDIKLAASPGVCGSGGLSLDESWRIRGGCVGFAARANVVIEFVGSGSGLRRSVNRGVRPPPSSQTKLASEKNVGMACCFSLGKSSNRLPSAVADELLDALRTKPLIFCQRRALRSDATPVG